MSRYSDLIQEFADENQVPVLLLHLNQVSKLHLTNVHKLLAGEHFEKIAVFLQTPGGDADAAFMISKIVKGHAKSVDVVVPFYAKSAGTLMSLMGERILLTELSELGPLDAQVESVEKGSKNNSSALKGYRALEQVQNHCALTLDSMTQLLLSRSELQVAEAIQQATEFVAKTSARLYEKIDPIMVGELSSALQIGERYAVRILTQLRGMDGVTAAGIANQLVNGYPSHGYVLDATELMSMGLVAEEVSDGNLGRLLEIRNLMIKELKNMDSAYAIIELYKPRGGSNVPTAQV